MDGLIKTFKQDDGTIAVDARNLHDFLEVGKDFTSWFKDMVNYGFEQGKDFTPFLVKSTGGRPRAGYALTLDMAKELSMIQRTKKGKQARQYFIAVEKKQLALPTSPRELAKLALSANEETNQRLDGIEGNVKDLQDNQSIAPGEYTYISHQVSKAVKQYVLTHQFVTTRQQRAKLYKDISRGLNEVTGIKTRTQLRRKDFDVADEFIASWQPSTATVQIIKQLSGEAAGQTSMEM